MDNYERLHLDIREAILKYEKASGMIVDEVYYCKKGKHSGNQLIVGVDSISYKATKDKEKSDK